LGIERISLFRSAARITAKTIRPGHHLGSAHSFISTTSSYKLSRLSACVEAATDRPDSIEPTHKLAGLLGFL
jgi:hypothetical protein